MKPIMIHEDGSDCSHVGPPQSTVLDDGGPRCAGGILVTRIRFNGHEMTVEDAVATLNNIANVFAYWLNETIASFVKLASNIGIATGQINILTAAVDAYDKELALEQKEKPCRS